MEREIMEMPYYTNLNERTANGDKRLINLLYQKIELQQTEIELLKKELALQRLSDFTQEWGLEK
jgi:hypothetical protein